MVSIEHSNYLIKVLDEISEKIGANNDELEREMNELKENPMTGIELARAQLRIGKLAKSNEEWIQLGKLLRNYVEVVCK